MPGAACCRCIVPGGEDTASDAVPAGGTCEQRNSEVNPNTKNLVFMRSAFTTTGQ
jgi:hypothetical protein